MSVAGPALRESEQAIESLRAAEHALWAERLADMLARMARLGESGSERRETEIAGAPLNENQATAS
jgi:hypothetical protein